MSEMAPAGAQTAQKWSSEARSLFDELMTKGPPEGLREAAIRGVRRESERLARQRGGARVELDDVATACLAVSPPIFRPNVIADLESRGLDVARICAAIEAEPGAVSNPRKETT